jgi:hypothetical protein
MRGIKFAQRLFRRRLKRETEGAVKSLTDASHRRQKELSKELANLNKEAVAKILFGKAMSGQTVKLPVEKITAHGLAVGASGAGKSYFALSVMSQLLNLSSSSPVSWVCLDAKGELFERVTQYLYAHLYRLSSEERKSLKKRITMVDFSNADLITPYNILARQQYLPDEAMVANRIDTISEQFSGLSDMSVRMKMILKYFFLLMAEFDLPLPSFEKLCADPLLLTSLVERSQNVQVREYFLHRFDDESKSTLLALRQRIDSLLVSEGVRFSLSASFAPDFATLQDQGSIILINTAGPTITRGVSELLQSLILSDIKQSVFRRLNPTQLFIWFLDEAQNLYKTAVNREHMADLLTMARSFGSFFVLLTQSLTSAVRNQDILNSILANVRWIVMLRSTLRDAELIAPSIPLTGMLTKSRHKPFEPVHYLTESEEIKVRLKEVTKLPDRIAYLCLKAHLNTAVKITTPQVLLPHEIAGCSKEELDRFKASERLGLGMTKEDIAEEADRREKRLKEVLWPSTKVSSTSGSAAKVRTKEGRRLVKFLEDEYAKKQS